MSDDFGLVPLSRDLELRPRGGQPAGLYGLLGPRLAAYVADLDANIGALKRLADEAREAHHAVAEAAIRAKLAELLVRVAKLAEEAAASVGPREIRSQDDLPRWDDLRPEVQRELERWLDRTGRQEPP